MSLSNVVGRILSTVSAPLAADAGGYFQNVETKFESAINTLIPFVWMAVAAAIIGIGLMCIIGSERSKEAAKSKFVGVVVGCGLVVGAVYIAKGIAGMLQIGG